MKKISIVILMVLLLTGCSVSRTKVTIDNIVTQETSETGESKENDTFENSLENSGKENTTIEDTVPENSIKKEISPENVSEDDLIKLLDEIKALLEKSSKGSGNAMAELLGLSDKLDEIKKDAAAAIKNGDKLKNNLSDWKDSDTLFTGYEEISDYKNKMEEISADIKTAKKNQDIDKLEKELDNMKKTIEKYNEYLLEVL